MDLKLKEITWLRLVFLLVWTVLVMLKRGLNQLIEVIEGRVFDKGSQTLNEGVDEEPVQGAKLLPPLSDEIVLNQIWPCLHREVNISLLWRRRRVSKAWKESVGTTLEWTALEVVRVDTPGYIQYLRGRGERRASLRERVKDELRAITRLLSERLEDYVLRSERIRVTQGGFGEGRRDWSSTGTSVQLANACMWSRQFCCRNVCSCDESSCDQDEEEGFEVESISSSESSLRAYYPRHLVGI